MSIDRLLAWIDHEECVWGPCTVHSACGMMQCTVCGLIEDDEFR